MAFGELPSQIHDFSRVSRTWTLAMSAPGSAQHACRQTAEMTWEHIEGSLVGRHRSLGPPYTMSTPGITEQASRQMRFHLVLPLAEETCRVRGVDLPFKIVCYEQKRSQGSG
eukprot:2096200-Rhodomonas_salina.1